MTLESIIRQLADLLHCGKITLEAAQYGINKVAEQYGEAETRRVVRELNDEMERIEATKHFNAPTAKPQIPDLVTVEGSGYIFKQTPQGHPGIVKPRSGMVFNAPNPHEPTPEPRGRINTYRMTDKELVEQRRKHPRTLGEALEVY